MDRVIRIQTSRGRDGVFYVGYLYRFDRQAASENLQWRCLRDDCYGRLRTDVNYNHPTVFGNPHAHPSNAEVGIIRNTLSRMRERAAMENTSIPQIYLEEINRLSGSASASGIDTSLYRARRRRLPPLPRTRPEIVIPQSLQSTPSGENFVLLQLQNNDIIVFDFVRPTGAKEDCSVYKSKPSFGCSDSKIHKRRDGDPRVLDSSWAQLS
ncbi:hypothetical protein R1sor_008530 [Riccia sorocarpa]|uniref:FLYWCH-type domain-containing protein n=1 Tax=Riccia sorocarpa TaxID=122646 RepID=A0ABD3HZX6_9MARC